MALVAVLSLVLVTACARITGIVPAPVPLPSSGTFRAGAAKVDVTPPPGFPMGGHAIAGTVARGYWTRLFARAIYLEDASGRPLVLVSCDLWAMPAGLADRVVELAATRLGLSHLGRAHVVLAATHTHQSPGNFASAKLYNEYAQRLAGFDHRLFEFLAHRIAVAIAQAFDARQPATVHWLDTVVPGLARNRSLEAFMLNPEARQILAENATLPGDSASYRAVDPRLALLRISTSTQPVLPIAVAAFISVHPTAMSHATEVYNSDLFGVATTLAEHELRGVSHAQAPVVALFNGAEGDIQPAWQQQDRRNALRLGRLLADKIVAPGIAAVPLEMRLAPRFAVVPLAGGCFTEPSPFAKGEVVTRCAADAPLPGVAMLGGAEDGRTLLYELGWQEGVKRTEPRLPDHGVKQPALDPTFLTRPFPVSLTRLVTSRAAVPHQVPIGVYSLSPQLVLATLPGEFTMVMGRRIAEAVTQAMHPRPERVLLVGLANEYVSYFATPQEYEAQHYEGASTLYGLHAGPLIKEALRQLAAAPLAAVTSHAFHYGPGAPARFGWHSLGAPPHAPDDGLAGIAQDLDTGLPQRDLPQFCWQDKAPALPWPAEARGAVTPHAAIESRRGDGTWETLCLEGSEETDAGLDFITIAMEATEEAGRWCALWMPPATVDRSLLFRFRVATLHHVPVYSTAFWLE
jgi:neutral ceramidase